MAWNQTLKTVVVVTLCVEASLAAKQDAAPPAALLVRFCDGIGLAEEDLRMFTDAATRLLRTAGIETTWVHCRVGSDHSNPSGCRELLKANEIVMKLLQDAPGRRYSAMGHSLLTEEGTGVYATLFLGRIKDVAEVCNTSALTVMALAAVHEIGHLLGGPGHYPRGIMQAKWTSSQIMQLTGHGFLFTGPQTTRLRANLAGRGGLILAAEK